jgi:hypothetical protein
VLRKTPDYPAGSAFFFNGMQEIQFGPLKKTLIGLVPEKAQ